MVSRKGLSCGRIYFVKSSSGVQRSTRLFIIPMMAMELLQLIPSPTISSLPILSFTQWLLGHVTHEAIEIRVRTEPMQYLKVMTLYVAVTQTVVSFGTSPPSNFPELIATSPFGTFTPLPSKLMTTSHPPGLLKCNVSLSIPIHHPFQLLGALQFPPQRQSLAVEVKGGLRIFVLRLDGEGGHPFWHREMGGFAGTESEVGTALSPGHGHTAPVTTQVFAWVPMKHGSCRAESGMSRTSGRPSSSPLLSIS